MSQRTPASGQGVVFEKLGIIFRSLRAANVRILMMSLSFLEMGNSPMIIGAVT